MPIAIPELGGDRHRLWLDLIDLGRQPVPWTLIGAHMVALHAWEHGRAARPSNDVDVLVNVRSATGGTHEISRYFVERGYELDHVTPTNLGHHFVRGQAEVDVLAPDGLGARASTTTIPPARTVRVPGGTQALRRSEPTAVKTRRTRGELPRPNLLGAILVKVRAIEVDDVPAAQRADVALLLSLVTDPDPLVHDVEAGERRWLRRHGYFADPASAEWDEIEHDDPELCAAVFRRLADL